METYLSGIRYTNINLARFPLGSGINGNAHAKAGDCSQHITARFPLGSGINGNSLSKSELNLIVSFSPASLWEVELMETIQSFLWYF
ncbi:hypothetical protein CRC_02657 [Cylindrospermopsis raciborskii CS-505]|nr:hypothetical protein CRC_02657 [Cylindrospermopsis raciborskii CS-505]